MAGVNHFNFQGGFTCSIAFRKSDDNHAYIKLLHQWNTIAKIIYDTVRHGDGNNFRKWSETKEVDQGQG